MSVAKMGMTIEEAAEMSGIGRNTMRALLVSDHLRSGNCRMQLQKRTVMNHSKK